MGLGMSEIIPIVIALVVGVPLAALWVVALVDLAGRPASEWPPSRDPVMQRMTWASLLILFSGVAAVAYYLLVIRPYPRERF